MKTLKFLALAIFLITFIPISASAFNLELYCLYGLQNINNVDIKNIYGNGKIFSPGIWLDFWKGLSIGAGYEGGYSKHGYIGIYEEPTNLKMKGIDVFVGYQIKSKFFSLFIKGGYGIYYYKQYIDNPELPFKVDSKKNTFIVGGGLKLFPIKNLFIIAEVKYVPIKVKPYEEEIDLGGIRALGGLGLRF